MDENNSVELLSALSKHILNTIGPTNAKQSLMFPHRASLVEEGRQGLRVEVAWDVRVSVTTVLFLRFSLEQ